MRVLHFRRRTLDNRPGAIEIANCSRSRQDRRMALTSHSVLRELLIRALFESGGSASRADVLSAMTSAFGAYWTAEDKESPPSRPGDEKWRNRTSWQRVRLIEDGLLNQQDDGIWSLSPAGLVLGKELAATSPSSWRSEELKRRLQLWQMLGGGDRGEISSTAMALREAGLYAGYRGIFLDKATTSSLWTPDGVALALVHLGQSYSNELTENGLIYHYPDTAVPGRDAAEIAGILAAYETGLPVFAVIPGDSSKARGVRLGYVEQVDNLARSALITFVENSEALPPPPPTVETGKSFTLEDEDAEWVWSKRRSRKNQSRFAFQVAQRYGEKCAFCELEVASALEAAHLHPKSSLGSDDARNGLVLCTNHHRMFDAHLIAIDPGTTKIHTAPGTSSSELRLTKTDLSHLPAKPHPKALTSAWEVRQKAWS